MVQSMPMPLPTGTMTRERVMARWQDIARAAAGDVPIAPDCAQHLFQCFEDAAETLEQAGKLGDLHALRDADDGAWKLVRQMVTEAENQGLRRLQESTFFGAKSVICPLWPFCS